MTSRFLLISMILLAWCGCIFEDENEDDKINDPFQCESPKFSHDQLTVEFLQENFYEEDLESYQEDIKSCVVEGLGFNACGSGSCSGEVCTSVCIPTCVEDSRFCEPLEG